MQKKRRPSYTDEVKKRAVELTREKGVDAVAKELDISQSSIIRWRAQHGESPVRNKNGKLTSREMKNLLDEQQRRIEQLEKEKKIAEWPCGNASLWSAIY